MSGSVGPNYYTCPLSFLAEVPEPASEYAADWREKVRAYHKDQAARQLRVACLIPGNTVELVGARIPSVTLVSVKPLIGEFAGIRYRIPLRLIAL